jgi:uncharacterized protein (TIGR03437 family)
MLPTGASSIELQEIVGNGQMPAGTIQITGLALRAAPGAGGIKANFGTLTVTLSTSPNYPNTSGTGKTLMSSTFAANVGPDKTVVYTGSNVTLSDTGCPAPGPCPFDITIPFTNPFTYTNGSGPLLVDIVMQNSSVTSAAFDAQSSTAPGGGVAQVLGTGGAPTGTFAYQGNILQFTYTGGASTGGSPTGPSIAAVVNPAGAIQPGFPNYGLAQGSIVTIYGSLLGPATAAQAASLPLPTTAGLGGTTVTIGQNGSAIPVPLIYVGAGQINAVIPSTTPLGSNTLTVSYNGASASTVVPVVTSNFGIVEYGTRQAVVTFADYAVVSPSNSAKPGDTLIIWGTGLGPLPTGQSDASGAPLDPIAAQTQVLVGGVPAMVVYQGRTPGSAGLDQIVFVVPSGAPLGCAVPVMLETTNGTALTVSNSPTIALASSDGAACTDSVQNVQPSTEATLLAKSNIRLLAANMNQSVVYNPSLSGTLTPSTTASASVYMVNYTPAQFQAQAPSFTTTPSLGTCVTTTYQGSDSGKPTGTGMNGGSPVTITPSSGAQLILSATATGIYQAQLTSLAGGTYQFSSPGGPDAGPLSFKFPAPQVTWTNMSQIATSGITRANGFTVNWTGGDSTGFVVISGQGFTSGGAYQFQFGCSVPATAGTFTIPASALLGMPPGGNAMGSVTVATQPYPASLGTQSGFDVTLNLSSFSTTVPVTFR